MFLKISLFIFLFTGLALFSCSSSKEFPKNYKGEQIHFGQGGGFTGAVNYFALLDDGRLFQRGERDTLFTFRDDWKTRFVTQVMTSYHTLQLDSISYYEPGDIYYFIKHIHSDGPEHRITWGRSGFTPDPKLIDYYTLLYKSTKPRS